MQDEKTSLVARLNSELNVQLADASSMRALMATVFKGFRDDKTVKQACLEAMMRGYTFQDILNKRIYAIPYGGGYSLVQSIADVRAIAMNNGQVGKSAPEYEMDGDKIVSCSVTVKRLSNGYIGEYTTTVFFDEYFKKGQPGKPSQWETKPRTMIAKVAEMHALRMAFPDHLEQAYTEEEFEGPQIVATDTVTSRAKAAQQAASSLTMGALKNNENNYANEETQDAPTYTEGAQVE